MLLWAFFENSHAGEDLWHSFLTQHFNFPFPPLIFHTLWCLTAWASGVFQMSVFSSNPVQKGTLKCTLTMLLVFLLKRSQYFQVSTVFEIFALPQSFFSFFGGADRFYRTCLTRNKHLPRVKISQEACMTLKLQRDIKANKPQCWKHSQCVCSFQTQRSVMACTECMVSEPCCIAVGGALRSGCS